MQTKFFVIVAALAVVLGLASVFAWVPESGEFWLWSGAGAIWIVMARKMMPDDRFRHILFGAAIAGFVAADIKILLWDTYVANHPNIAAYIAEAQANGDFTRTPRTSIMVSGIVTGLMFGFGAGAFNAIFDRLRGPMPVAAADEEE